MSNFDDGGIALIIFIKVPFFGQDTRPTADSKSIDFSLATETCAPEECVQRAVVVESDIPSISTRALALVSMLLWSQTYASHGRDFPALGHNSELKRCRSRRPATWQYGAGLLALFRKAIRLS